ncbi:ABC-2 type transport system ATP-binding protein [Stigmatella aurantiaca]|uniref:ABC-2 type transport system ATP-binding protein n=1 Tax=Stigmatella aurantiaca TaxID=41 RepID=A0A1H7XKX6_STIAU|nr:ABC transporter ATP-binding protein [Stigmatella aurantiaca]SEM34572.1 ABC-2 type transport system ATP-binding protein [Stigmatella aurantiaca]
MSSPVLDLQGLTKTYGAFTALSDVSLSIRPGEIFALLGPNGAGKTTLIGSVCGLVKKTSGSIRLFGQDLDQDPVRPRYDVGLVPQEINFDPFFSVAESLHIQMGFYGRPRDEARVDEVLTALNLHAKKDALTRALSGGMKRRLLIAKALVHRPKLVFLDEPTAGVDVELRRDLWTYVRRLASEGTTIVLTTHYLEEAEELADRVGVINEGRLLLVEDKASVLRRFGEKRLVVTFEQPVAELPEPGRRFNATLSEDRRTLTYVEREGNAPAGALLTALYGQGLPISDVETRRSRMEDVLIEILRGRPQPKSA